MKFSKRELQVLVNALLFTGCIDICLAETDQKEYKEYLKLAVRINKKTDTNPDLSIHLLEGKFYEDEEVVKKIKKNFKIKRV